MKSILARVKEILGIGPSTEPPLTSLESTDPKAVPAFELIPCDTCDQPFYRVQSPHPSTTCIDCELRAWDGWHQNYEARQAAKGSLIRRVS